MVQKEKISSERQLCGWKCLVYERHQRSLARPVWTDRKPTVAIIQTEKHLRNHKNVCNRRGPHLKVSLQSGRNCNVRLSVRWTHWNRAGDVFPVFNYPVHKKVDNCTNVRDTSSLWGYQSGEGVEGSQLVYIIIFIHKLLLIDWFDVLEMSRSIVSEDIQRCEAGSSNLWYYTKYIRTFSNPPLFP